jgi:uncharacterized membrane protein (DUF485 family)
MSKTVPDHAASPRGPIPVETQERLLQIVMRRQGALSLRVGVLFLLPLLALPWLNQTQPALLTTRLFGFSLSWLILGICFFPLTWILSAYFVHTSDRIEAECTRLGREMLPPRSDTEADAVAAQEERMV